VINGLADDIAEHLEGALEQVNAKIISLSLKAEEALSLARKKRYLDQERKQIEKVLRSIYRDIGKDIKSTSIDLAAATPEIIDSMVQAPGITIKLGVPNLNRKQLESWFQSTQIEGTYFSDYLKKMEANAVSRIVSETRQSLILNEGLRQTAKRIQNALDIGRRSAEGLAHNSLHAASNWSERQYWIRNQDQIKAMRYVAELDRKTTPLCRSLDGKQFKLDEAPQPPLHWKCRSMLMPVFKNKALNDALNTSATRPARIETGKHVVHHRSGGTSTTYRKMRAQHPQATVSYNEWLNSLVHSKDPKNVSFAREVLGPTRFNLVKSGKLKMESLYYAGRLRTIKQLQELMK